MRSLSFAVASVGLVACESTSSPVPVEPEYEHHVTAEMVAGAALAALQTDGRFKFETPATSASQLSVQEAGAQALQFARYVNWPDPHVLTLCGNPHFVHPQLGSIPSDSMPPAAVKSFLQRFGPQWLIPLCGSNGDPQMTVQIALDSNSIRFANGKPIEPDATLLSAWAARTVPLNWPDPLPLSAERAVRFAWETFGVRVTEVPQLYFRGHLPYSGMYAWHAIGSAHSCNRWRVTLENDVRVRGMSSFQQSTTRILWIASGTCFDWIRVPYLHIPLADQPTSVKLDYLETHLLPPLYWVIDVPLVVPIHFEIGTRAQ